MPIRRRAFLAGVATAAGGAAHGRPRSPEGDSPPVRHPAPSGPAVAEDRFEGADAYIAAAMRRWEVPGLAIAAVKDGKVVLSRGYGVCEIGGDRRVDEGTAFDIASCAKSFISASLALLVDQGRVGWDDPVVKHLPECRFPDPYMTRHATLRDLLCHRTGLQRGDLLASRGDVGRDELVRRIRFLESEAPFRTEDSYSNLMYIALGEVVAKVAGRSWEQVVADDLLRPLGMHSTSTALAEGRHRTHAPRHWSDAGRITSRGAPAPGAVGGGFYSCTQDMAVWLKLQLSEGRHEGRQILSPEVVREMHAMHQAVPIRTRPPGNVYAARFLGAGLGWYTWDYRGRKLVVHSGAWGAIVGLVPEEGLGVVVLSNLDWNGLSGVLMYRVLDAYCAGPEPIWDTANFEQFDAEGPGHAYRSRDAERARLEEARAKEKGPTLALDRYAGRYDSPLFGDLRIAHEGGRLSLRIGPFTTELAPWEGDVFYAAAPLRLNYDWLVHCHLTDGAVDRVRLEYVGWHEPDVTFRRAEEGE